MMTEDKAREDLRSRGYAIAYTIPWPKGMPDEKSLHKSFPSMFVVFQAWAWCHRPGEVILKAIRRIVDASNDKHKVTDARKASVQREAIVAIKTEFSEDSIRALTASRGVVESAEIVAERAIARMDMMRTGKRPRGGTEP
jgi:hypothetical protein